MSTWASFYIKTTEFEQVVSQLNRLTGISASSVNNFPADYYNHFLLDEGLPNYIIIGQTSPDWITVHYNSFNKLTEWTTTLSTFLHTDVFIVMAQSVSDYYYLAYYKNGEKVRELEFCYTGDMDEINYGAPFPFETEALDDTGMFDFATITRYLHQFGITDPDDYNKVVWTILHSPSSRRTIQQLKSTIHKPWWKFWL